MRTVSHGCQGSFSRQSGAPVHGSHHEGIVVIPDEESHMKRTIIGFAAAALLGVSGLAAAHDCRDFGRDQDRGYSQGGVRGYGRDYGYGRVQPGWYGERYERFGRAPGYAVRAWRRGEYLPPAYWSRGYVVDYPRYRLYAPPRGARWVRVDDDVILTALATGLVLDVVYNLGR
jgi:Ni/Co efflux regulator RcnB